MAFAAHLAHTAKGGAFTFLCLLVFDRLYAVTNRLKSEKSPYLLQHADNPVDWYPWGEEAFAKARREDKPIFLSIGYSTCHWCHVMERESFQDPEVARLLNEVFVNIKVDREERPDLDSIYMSVCQLVSGQGGWPLTIAITPEQKPFFASTYIPRENRFGRVGLLEIIPRIKELWENRRGEILESAEKITGMLRQFVPSGRGDVLGPAPLDTAYRNLAQIFDAEHGGFGTAPKFPTPHTLLFLLRYWKRTGNGNAREKVEATLQAMRRGGIFDQVGFGFHRYSTDKRWLVPHFEKMLYDQALLAMAYTEAFQATGREEYRQTAREIFSYVLRDLADPAGGFYSAEDADSEGEEGKYYLWSTPEVREILGEEGAALICRGFNLEDEGNYIDAAAGGKTGRNIPHLEKSLEELSEFLNVPDLARRVAGAREKLLAAREKRVRPHRDDKILTDWNGLMIAALARGAQALDEPAYAEAAEKAADFILAGMVGSGGKLLHRYRDGQAAISAHLDDYAFLVWGLLDLYEATFAVRYLRSARDLARTAIRRFWDDESGGFFLAAEDAGEMLVRPKEIYDGAVPSGNSAMALNLLRLARFTSEAELEERAAGIEKAFSRLVANTPNAYAALLLAVEFRLGPPAEVVIAGNPEAEDTRAMIRRVRGSYFPNKVVLLRPEGEEPPEIVDLAPFTREQNSVDGKAAAYVCRDYQCRSPVTDPEKMAELIGETGRNGSTR